MNSTTDSLEDAPAHRSFGRKLLGWLTEGVLILIGAVVIATLLRTFVGQMFVIPSGSMENTLLEHDRVAVQKIVGFERGDIVVFRDTQNWLIPVPVKDDPVVKTLVFLGLAPDESTGHLIKRVIGTAGDRVVCCDVDGRITVNGAALDETGYLYTDDAGVQNAPSLYPFDVVVPAGRIFVMGDHREASADSRCHLSENALGVTNLGGFPSRDSVVGVAAVTMFPFERWRTFATPTVFGGIPAPASPAPERPVITGELPPC